MTTVVGVKFNNNGRLYYFAPGNIEGLVVNTGVIVETARGLEFGKVVMEATEVKDEDIVQPLKSIVRIATPEDLRRRDENEKKKAEAMAICQEKIDKHHLGMKLIDVEYTFDTNKVIFYFTADGRVDFRELVKDLAGAFHMRIELRQIGARDEAKMIGGCGMCGRPLCCASWMGDFQPVSIKMAKNQNLSLNPTKISGICGRLLCCLKYENEAYSELHKGMPDVNEKIETPDGRAKVTGIDLLRSKIQVRLYTGEKEEDGSDKLSPDFRVYDKAEIKRISPKHNKGGQRSNDILKEVDDEYKSDMAKLLDEEQ